MEPFSTSNIALFFENNLKFIKKGEDHVNSNHIRKFWREDHKIFAFVDPSFGPTKNKTRSLSYVVHIDYDDKTGPTSATCSCPVGKLRCSHMAALMIHANKLLSRTDFGSSWSRPTSSTTAKSQLVKEIWPDKNPKQILRSPLKSDDLQTWRNIVDSTKHFGLYWHLLPEPEQKETELKFLMLEQLLKDCPNLSTTEKVTWITAKLICTQETISLVAESTIGQRNNSIWLTIRKYRLTSSNYGKVIDAMVKGIARSPVFSPSFMKSLLGMYNLDGVQAVQWGVSHEAEAVQEFGKLTKMKVKECGIFLHENGYLAASPDGLIGDTDVLEVKCPFSYRNKTLEEMMTNEKFYLYKKSGEWKLKEDHAYYHQIMGALFATKRTTCHFFVWTPTWNIHLRIARNEEWSGNLYLLDIFYKEILLPCILCGCEI